MARFCFNWTITGSTIVESDTLNAAQLKFDEITVEDLWATAAQQDFEQDQVLVESAPGIFDEVD